MPVHNIGDKPSFDNINSDDKLIVLDAFATWCGPCKVISPKVETLSNDYSNVGFYKFDVDEIADLAQELGIRAMPTFLLFKDGSKVDEVVGANFPALVNAIKKHI